jgi:tetratricopeptide (TPR) repeat protein
MGIPIFCAYAKSDEAYRQQLENHLSILKQQGLITFWHNQQGNPGDNLADIIESRLSQASIILLLVSPDFFTSDFYTGPAMQLVWQRQQAREAQVIPIVLRSCLWQQSPIGALPALPIDGRPIRLWRYIDEAWSRVVADVQRVIEDPLFLLTSTPHAGRAFPSLWEVPYPRNPFFVGREAIFQTLRKALVPGSKATALTQAVVGLGGIGKTQVALEYAYRFASSYEAVFWLQADSQEILTTAYLQLATQVLGLPEQSEAEQQVNAVKHWMETHQRWLLILDNVEQPEEVLSTFLPGKYLGSVLITTRMREAGPQAQSELLPVLSRYEGVLFLLRRARKIGQEALIRQATRNDVRLAKELYHLMNGLPLALDQAGAYIAETGSSLQRYRDLYQQFRPKLLSRRQAQAPHPASVCRTFELSWQMIEGQSPLAGKVLQFCAFLAPSQIPERLVLEGVGESERTWDELEKDEALGLLHRYSLVERADDLLSLHRLVQEVLQDILSEDERQHCMEQAVLVVNTTFPSGEHGTWPLCEFLLPHALICTRWIEVLRQKKPEGARLLGVIGHYLHERAQYRDAEPHLKQALSIREEQLGAEHPDTATSLNNLALLYWRQGRHQEAEPLYQRARAIYEQQLGPSDPDVARPLNGLAVLYSEQGKYAEAEPLYQRALKIREEQLGPDHPQVASSLNNMASLYKEQGKYAEAEPLYQRALKIREEQLGPDHPQVASPLNNMAILYKEQGKYAEAEPLYQRALSILEKQLGPDHPQVAHPLDGLAELYREQGKYARAEPLYQRALKIREQKLEPDHPYTKQVRENLAKLFSEMEKERS